MAYSVNTVQIGRAKLSMDFIKMLCPPAKTGQLHTQHRDKNKKNKKFKKRPH